MGNGVCTSCCSRVAVRRAVPELLISRAPRRPHGDDYRLRANRAQAAHARKCMRRETAIEPSTGSMPEFLKIEEPEQVR